MRKLILVSLIFLLVLGLVRAAEETGDAKTESTTNVNTMDATSSRVKSDTGFARKSNLDLGKKSTNYIVKADLRSSREDLRKRYTDFAVKRAEALEKSRQAAMKVSSKYQKLTKTYERPPVVKPLALKTKVSPFKTIKPGSS